MKRRAALKNMGMAFGYTVAAPTLISVLNSCKEKVAYAEWVPKHLNKDLGFAIATLSDVILPRTETPSATDVGVHQFIDEFYGLAMPEEQQAMTSMMATTFMNKVKALAGKETLADLEAEDFLGPLDTYLAELDEETEEAHGKAIESYAMAIAEEKAATLDEEIQCFTFANSIRGLSTWAYRNSEKVGEEILVYQPVPGAYIACGDLQELTGGMDYSI